MPRARPGDQGIWRRLSRLRGPGDDVGGPGLRAHVCVVERPRVCVCVRDTARGRVCVGQGQRASVCVRCVVCVCARERERQREEDAPREGALQRGAGFSLPDPFPCLSRPPFRLRLSLSFRSSAPPLLPRRIYSTPASIDTAPLSLPAPARQRRGSGVLRCCSTASHPRLTLDLANLRVDRRPRPVSFFFHPSAFPASPVRG